MLAVDTNVVVRLLVADDKVQARRAKALFAGNQILIYATVLLEVEWVLRSVYGLSRPKVCALLTALAGLPKVELDEPQRVARALEWLGLGMDFADALHLAACSGDVSFATFDRKLVAAARKTDVRNVKAV